MCFFYIMILFLIFNFYKFFVYLLVFIATVLCKGGRLGVQIDEVKNVFYMDLHGLYEI